MGDYELCKGTVIEIPYKNVTLSTGVQRHGLEVHIGLAPQVFSMWPDEFGSRVVKNSDVMTTNKCGSTYPDWGPAAYLIQKDRKPGRKQPPFGVQGGSDTVSFSNITLEALPFRLDDETSIKSGTIGSRTWALDQGLTGDSSIKPDDWVDGQLTLGGYDESRYSGEMYPVKINDGTVCPLRATVDSFTYNLPNGTTVKLSQDPYFACLSTTYPLLTVPDSIFARLNSVYGGYFSHPNRSTGSFYLWGYRDVLNSTRNHNNFVDGNFTITLAGGFSVTIPNSEIVKPWRDIDDRGQAIIKNGSNTRVLLVNNLVDMNKNDTPLLGMPFLAASYLVVDQDKKLFRLAQSRRLQPGNTRTPIRSNLKAILPSQCINQPALPSLAVQTDTTSEVSNKEDIRGLALSVIAGIAVGGVLGISLISVLSFWLFKRQRRKRDVQDFAGWKDVYSYEPDPANHYKAEVHGSSYVPDRVELQGVSDRKMAPHEQGKCPVFELDDEHRNLRNPRP